MARTIKPSDDPDFDRFYKVYPIHRAPDKARRVWNRLSAEDRLAAIDGIASYCSNCRQYGAAYTYPQGYLSGRRWEDEPLSSTAAGQNTGGTKKEQHDGSTGSTPHCDMETW